MSRLRVLGVLGVVLLIAVSISMWVIISIGRDLNSPTPLMSTAARCETAAVKSILQSGVDVNQRDSKGATALHAAAGSGLDCLATMTTLGSLGADATLLTDRGDTVLTVLAATRTKAPDGGVTMAEWLLASGAGPCIAPVVFKVDGDVPPDILALVVGRSNDPLVKFLRPLVEQCP